MTLLAAAGALITAYLSRKLAGLHARIAELEAQETQQVAARQEQHDTRIRRIGQSLMDVHDKLDRMEGQ